MQKGITVEKILLECESKAQNLLPTLKKIGVVFGYVSKEDAMKVAEYFELSLARVYEVASFYDLIETKKTANLEIKVCSGGDCVLGDSTGIVHEIENYFRIKAGDENNPKVKLRKISCLGRCGEGPIMIVNGRVYEKVTRSSIYKILEEWA